MSISSIHCAELDITVLEWLGDCEASQWKPIQKLRLCTRQLLLVLGVEDGVRLLETTCFYTTHMLVVLMGLQLTKHIHFLTS